MALTAHQEDIKEQILLSLKNGVKRIKLIGSAGTGKTFLVSELVKIFLSETIGKPVYVTAPTNKALAILMSKIVFNPPAKYLIFKTIHSALKMNRYINPKTGAVSFVQNKYGGNKIDKDDFRRSHICIVDECSMLNTQLVELMENYNFPIIYVGCANYCPQ